VKLGTALERLGNASLPFKPDEAVRGMLQEMLGDAPEGGKMVDDLLNEATFEQALQNAPFTPGMKSALNAQLRNTAAPTILHAAGSRINVIPSNAQASFDGRTLPGATAESFEAEIRAVLGDTPGVEIEVYEYWPGSASSFDTDLFRIMKEVTRELTGSTLVPYMATGASDARFAEPLGVNVYGFGPMRNEPGASPSDLMHAHDERISLANINLGLRALYETVVRIAGRT
jgi:acetylornithine deacetylase/succinyl-diaminopimelate desuccinylase-like protein